jgi:hypothetical protein
MKNANPILYGQSRSDGLRKAGFAEIAGHSKVREQSSDPAGGADSTEPRASIRELWI